MMKRLLRVWPQMAGNLASLGILLRKALEIHEGIRMASMWKPLNL